MGGTWMFYARMCMLWGDLDVLCPNVYVVGLKGVSMYIEHIYGDAIFLIIHIHI